MSKSLSPWEQINQNVSRFAWMGFLVQKVNYELYISNEMNWKYESRNEAMKLYFLALHLSYSDSIPNGIEIFIETSDGDGVKGPIFSSCSNSQASIAAPDFTFSSWPTVGIDSHSSIYYSLINRLNNSVTTMMEGGKIEEKKERNSEELDQFGKTSSDKAYFIGSIFQRRAVLLKGSDPTYTIIKDHTFQGANSRENRFVSHLEICQHRYLLHMPGRYIGFLVFPSF